MTPSTHERQVVSVVDQFYDALKSHDLPAILNCFTDDVVVEDPILMGATVHGADEFKAFIQPLWVAFPDLWFEPLGIAQHSADGSTMTQRWRGHGTFLGRLRPWPPGSFVPLNPTGRNFEFDGYELYEFRDGLICRWELFYDIASLAQRMGLMPSSDSVPFRVLAAVERLAAPVLRSRSRRAASRHVSVERTISAPSDVLFAVLTDPAQHSAIDGSHTLVDHENNSVDTHLGPGSIFLTPMTRWPRSLHRADLMQAAIATACRGRMRNTVVEFVENEWIAWRNFGHHIWRYELQPIGASATLVRETFDYEPNLAPWVLEIAGFPKRNASAMTATLQNLDRLCAGHSHLAEDGQ
jgi:ketosteroid isomerase-like protein